MRSCRTCPGAMRMIACIEDPAVIENIFHPSRCESPEAGSFDTPSLLAAVYWADGVSQRWPQGSDAGMDRRTGRRTRWFAGFVPGATLRGAPQTRSTPDQTGQSMPRPTGRAGLAPSQEVIHSSIPSIAVDIEERLEERIAEAPRQGDRRDRSAGDRTRSAPDYQLSTWVGFICR